MTLIDVKRIPIVFLVSLSLLGAMPAPGASAAVVAPTGLTLTASNTVSGKLSFSWNEVSDSDSYQAEIYTEADAESVAAGITIAPIQIIPTSQTSVLFSGLTNGTRYKARVFSRELGPSSGVTNHASIFSAVAWPYDAPSEPRAVTVSQSGVNALTVSWDTPSTTNGSPILRYVISTICESDCVSQSDVTSETTSSSMTSLSTAKTYKFTVKAVNARGQTAALQTAGDKPFGSIAAPSALAVTAGNAKLSASWSAVTVSNATVTGYSVQVVKASDQSIVIPAFVVNGSSTDLTSGLANGTSYQVKVAAKVGALSGSQKVSLSVTPAAPATPPSGNAPAAPAAAPASQPRSPAAVSTRTPLRVAINSKENATAVAISLGAKVPKGSKVTLTVSKSSRKICKISGGKLFALKPGTCAVSVSVQAPKPKKGKKPKPVKTTGSVSVS